MQHESGYVDVPLENAKWSTWSEQTRAKMEWRNSDGYGPINEGRVSFTIKRPVQYVKDYIVNPECEIRGGVMDHFVISTETPLRELSPKERLKAMARRSRENRRVIYTGCKVAFPLANRDYLVEQFSHSSSMHPGAEVVVGRSIYDEHLFSLKKSAERGFRRVNVHIKGYFLRPNPSDIKNSTDVIFVAGVVCEMIPQNITSKIAIKSSLKRVVDDLMENANPQPQPNMIRNIAEVAINITPEDAEDDSFFAINPFHTGTLSTLTTLPVKKPLEANLGTELMKALNPNKVKIKAGNKLKPSLKVNSKGLLALASTLSTTPAPTTVPVLDMRKTKTEESENDIWIEYLCDSGEHKGVSYFEKQSTGETTWERPGEGVTIRLAVAESNVE
ncbi:hypothetical protein TrLO_g2177 [Triparma laevis f. longispina]|nr:hypothetical protein TrLO_g2177 [Triparma laevis f. longispina]